MSMRQRRRGALAGNKPRPNVHSTRDNRILPRTPSGGNTGRRADALDWWVIGTLALALALMLVGEQVRMAVLGW